MISETRTEKKIQAEIDVPINALLFSNFVYELGDLESEIKKVKIQCERKLKKLRQRKKELQKSLLSRRQKQNLDVLEVKLFEEGKKQLWRNDQLVQEMPLTKQDLQISLFDYL